MDSASANAVVSHCRYVADAGTYGLKRPLPPRLSKPLADFTPCWTCKVGRTTQLCGAKSVCQRLGDILSTMH